MNADLRRDLLNSGLSFRGNWKSAIHYTELITGLMVVIPEERFIQRDSSSGYFFPFPLLATTTGHQQQGDENLNK